MKLSSLVKEIPITEMQGLRIGNAQDFEAMTGVTVLIFDEGAKWERTSAEAVRRRERLL